MVVLLALSMSGVLLDPAIAQDESQIRSLVEDLDDRNEEVRWQAVQSLGQMGPAAIPPLIETLQEEGRNVRMSAAVPLVRIGPAAILPLLDSLQDANKDVRIGAAWALASIAAAMGEPSDPDVVTTLQSAERALLDHPDAAARAYAPQITRTLDRIGSWSSRAPFVGNGVLVVLMVAVGVWIGVGLLLLWGRAIALWDLSEAFRGTLDPLPDWLGGGDLSLGAILIPGFLRYHPRVLDAWVARQIVVARANFERKRTVADRRLHVPIAVQLDGDVVDALAAADLRAVLGAGDGRLLIWGEGGAGKTSLACLIGRWAMADEPDQCPAAHPMLPVLLERELDLDVADHADPFTAAVHDELEQLIDRPVPEDLFRMLMLRRRVLVIVDHLSEMSDETRRLVRPGLTDAPAAALIVTSRIKEKTGDIAWTELKLQRVSGDRLFEFAGAYLRARGVRAQLAGMNGAAVFLLKLWLDQLASAPQEVDQAAVAMQRLALVLQRVSDANAAVPGHRRRDTDAVRRDLQAVAWACMSQHVHRPNTARIADVFSALAAIEPTEPSGPSEPSGQSGPSDRLAYLTDELGLIDIVQPGYDRVRFLLDPLAEYLAGLHLVERYRDDAAAWDAFLRAARSAPRALETGGEFMLALRDCCLARQQDVPIPAGMIEELERRVARIDRRRRGPRPPALGDDHCDAMDVLGDVQLHGDTMLETEEAPVAMPIEAGEASGLPPHQAAFTRLPSDLGGTAGTHAEFGGEPDPVGPSQMEPTQMAASQMGSSEIGNKGDRQGRATRRSTARR